MRQMSSKIDAEQDARDTALLGMNIPEPEVTMTTKDTLERRGMRGSLESFPDRTYECGGCGHDIFEHYSNGCTVSMRCPSSACWDEYGGPHGAHPNGEVDPSLPEVCACRVSLRVRYHA